MGQEYGRDVALVLEVGAVYDEYKMNDFRPQYIVIDEGYEHRVQKFDTQWEISSRTDGFVVAGVVQNPFDLYRVTL